MVNIYDSIKDVATDRFAFIKLVVWSIPVFWLMYLLIVTASGINYFICYCSSLFLLMLSITTIRRLLSGENIILPTLLNPIPILFDFIKTIFAIIPSVICSYALIVFFGFIDAQINLAENDIVFNVLSKMVYFVSGCIVLLGFLQYAETGKIIDAYNLVKVAKGLKEIIVGLIFYVMQAIIMNLFIALIPYYIISMVWGTASMAMAIWASLIIVFNVFVFAHYLGMLKREIKIY